ncbi:MAG: glycosyltransferase family 2 protein [Methanophagales archaeon ANME-1-THS]|nr:MAG: glycosyltransferase family 2 protein [Methanophagales archaeon ANME-1-THS]
MSAERTEVVMKFDPSQLTRNVKKTIAGIPAYNKEQTIGSLIHGAEEYVDEVIVVDDGSTDRTSTFALRTNATVIRHEKNLGKAAAVQVLINEALKMDADVLVLLDADFQHDPDEIPMLINPIRAEGYDLVLGSRKLKEAKKERSGKAPFYRPWGQYVLTVGSHLLSRAKFSDPECGFRALSRKAMEAMKFEKSGFFVESEMIYLAVKKGLKVIEVPITEIYTEGGSTLSPLKHGFGNLGQVIIYISEKRPLLFFGVSGALLAVLGAIMGVRVLYIAYFTERGGVALGSALVAVLFLVIGVFIVLTGLILNSLTRFVVSAIAEEKKREAQMSEHVLSNGRERALIREIKEIMKRYKED